MASQTRPAPQLYLITPQLKDETWAQELAPVLSAAPFACMLAQSAGLDDTSAKKILRALSPLAAEHNTTLLTSSAPLIAVRSDVDGCHLLFKSEESDTQLRDALTTLKPQRIVGVGGLKTKHDAMAAGEHDIDYVMFGEPSHDGYVGPFDQRLERVKWWADIFNVPCVAYAHELSEIADLCNAGADFIALGACLWSSSKSPDHAARDALDIINATISS
jgi:thiamine-phosphate pyrophosphorylase